MFDLEGNRGERVGGAGGGGGFVYSVSEHVQTSE